MAAREGTRVSNERFIDNTTDDTSQEFDERERAEMVHHTNGCKRACGHWTRLSSFINLT